MELWIERPSGLQLPDGCFQCPECGVAIKRSLVPAHTKEAFGEQVFFDSRIEIKRIQPWL